MDIIRLLTFKTNDVFTINGKYECKMLSEKPFSTFIRCNGNKSYESDSYVDVNKSRKARIQFMIHPDLTTLMSATLYFLKFDNNVETIESSITIIDVK